MRVNNISLTSALCEIKRLHECKEGVVYTDENFPRDRIENFDSFICALSPRDNDFNTRVKLTSVKLNLNFTQPHDITIINRLL